MEFRQFLIEKGILTEQKTITIKSSSDIKKVKELLDDLNLKYKNKDDLFTFNKDDEYNDAKVLLKNEKIMFKG